ncbi:MAG: hypothetical protein WCP12_13195, partial [bacterium]
EPPPAYSCFLGKDILQIASPEINDYLVIAGLTLKGQIRYNGLQLSFKRRFALFMINAKNGFGDLVLGMKS